MMTVVIDAVAETEVFVNGNGTITIKQKNWPDDESLVVFQAHYVDALISALIEARDEAAQ